MRGTALPVGFGHVQRSSDKRSERDKQKRGHDKRHVAVSTPLSEAVWGYGGKDYKVGGDKQVTLLHSWVQGLPNSLGNDGDGDDCNQGEDGVAARNGAFEMLGGVVAPISPRHCSGEGAEEEGNAVGAGGVEGVEKDVRAEGGEERGRGDGGDKVGPAGVGQGGGGAERLAQVGVQVGEALDEADKAGNDGEEREGGDGEVAGGGGEVGAERGGGAGEHGGVVGDEHEDGDERAGEERAANFAAVALETDGDGGDDVVVDAGDEEDGDEVGLGEHVPVRVEQVGWVGVGGGGGEDGEEGEGDGDDEGVVDGVDLTGGEAVHGGGDEGGEEGGGEERGGGQGGVERGEQVVEEVGGLGGALGGVGGENGVVQEGV